MEKKKARRQKDQPFSLSLSLPPRLSYKKKTTQTAHANRRLHAPGAVANGAAAPVDASASDGTTVVATGSQAGVGTFGDFFRTRPGQNRPRHLNFTVSLMVRKSSCCFSSFSFSFSL
jgi:hypothetical protein